MNVSAQIGDAVTSRVQRGQDLIRVAWAVILTIVLAAALWFGVASGRAGTTSAARPTAAPTVIGTAAVPGASADAQATPTDQQKAAWYLQQETTEQDYCSCSGK